MRHHETWLTEAGCDINIWRKSCAPIGRVLSGSSAAAGGNTANGRAAKKAAAAAAAAATASAATPAAAADGGSSEDAVAGVALDEEGGEEESEGAGGRAGRQSSTRLPDGEEPNDAGRGRVKGRRCAHRVDLGWLVSGMSRQLADTCIPRRATCG